MFAAALIVYATHVALSRPGKQHRADALRVLKLISGTATGAGLAAVVIVFLLLIVHATMVEYFLHALDSNTDPDGATV